MNVSDENLVRLVQAGDANALGQLLSRHYDLIFRVGFRLLGEANGAEDLAQDICANLPAKLKSFRGDAKFSTWLYRVTANAAKDQLRAQKRQNRLNDGWAETAKLQRDEAAQKSREMAWLAEAMANLSGDLRETVALVLGEEMTHAAAGQVLGISEGTVSWRMSEVKKTLRAMAQEEAM